MCSTPGASALGEGFCLCGRGLLPLRSERASASTGEGFCLCGRGLLPLRSERASAWLGVLPAVVLGTVVPSVITTVGADAVALAAEALAVSEGAAWSGMALTFEVLADWYADGGAEAALAVMALAAEAVSIDTGRWAVMTR